MLSHMVFDKIRVPFSSERHDIKLLWCVRDSSCETDELPDDPFLHDHVIRASFVLLYFKDADVLISLRLDHFSVSALTLNSSLFFIFSILSFVFISSSSLSNRTFFDSHLSVTYHLLLTAHRLSPCHHDVS